MAGSVCAELEALRGTRVLETRRRGPADPGGDPGTGRAVGVRRAGPPDRGTGHPRGRQQQGCTIDDGVAAADRLRISAGDAAARVNTARAILPRDLPTGGETPPELPELAAAVDAGAVGAEQTRTVVSTMRGLPAGVDPDTRDMARASLVANAQVTEPRVFAEFARQVADALRPRRHPGRARPRRQGRTVPGVPEHRHRVDRVQGVPGRPRGGTAVQGHRRPGRTPTRPSDGTADPRPAKVRRGQALVEVLRRFLDVGFAPTQGGERPHVTVTMDLDALHGKLGTAMLDHGGPITAAHARMLACDAMIIPAVLGLTPPRSWTWGPRSGCSRTRSAGPSPCGTADAPSPAATDPRRGATRIM